MLFWSTVIIQGTFDTICVLRPKDFLHLHYNNTFLKEFLHSKSSQFTYVGSLVRKRKVSCWILNIQYLQTKLQTHEIKTLKAIMHIVLCSWLTQEEKYSKQSEDSSLTGNQYAAWIIIIRIPSASCQQVLFQWTGCQGILCLIYKTVYLLLSGVAHAANICKKMYFYKQCSWLCIVLWAFQISWWSGRKTQNSLTAHLFI